MPRLAPILIALIAALAALAAPSPADAAQPCWRQLVNDYWADNRVDKIYPVECYRVAMEKLPRDVQEYSDAQDDLRRALLQAIRDERANRGFEGGAGGAGGGGGKGAPPIAAPPTADDDQPKGFISEVLNAIGPKNADQIPVPLLVLALIALLLLGAAGASYGARWYQARRLEVAPHPAPPGEPRA